MQHVSARPVTPAGRYLRILWAARVPFLAILGACVAVAAGITALQPRLYASQALLSVKPPPEVLAEAIRTRRPYLAPDGHLYDANDPDRQSGPGRYAPRLAAPGLVTLAARDAGILRGDASLDQKQAADWVSAERIEGADLIRLTVWQSTPEAAQKLAAAIIARGIEINRRDEAPVGDAELRRILTVVDPPTRPSSVSYPRAAVNLAVGFAFGVLAATAYVALREALGQA